MKTLTSRERLDRCFKHMEIDRPGIFIRGVDEKIPRHESFKPLREIVLKYCDLRPVYSPIRLRGGKELERVIEDYNEDFRKVINILHTPAGDLQSIHLESLKGEPGYTIKHFIETVEDAEKYLSLEDDTVLYDAEEFFRLDRKLGERGIVLVNLGFNPAGAVSSLMGSELFAVWSIENRELLHSLMEREMKMLYKIVKQLLNDGIGPYFGLSGEELVAPPLHGRKDFFDFNVKYDKPIVDLIHDHGGYIHIHCHGSLKKVLDGFIEIGADVLHPLEAPPMGDVTPQEAKEILGEYVCIEGNIQIGDLYERDAEEIEQMVLSLIDAVFYDRKGLIVCPTASPYIPQMSQKAFENYSKLIYTVINYRPR